MNPRSLIFALFLFGPTVALAHADLSASSIEDGATVTEPLTEVSLTFTEAAELSFSTFKVYPLPADPAPAASGNVQTANEADTAAGHDSKAASDTNVNTTEDHSAGGDAGNSEGGKASGGGHGTLDAAAETLMAEVINMQGDEAARADTGFAPTQGRSETVTLQLKDDLEPGAYAIMWRVLSVDAHTIEGFLTFTYDPGE